jgi:hypothetical protein
MLVFVLTYQYINTQVGRHRRLAANTTIARSEPEHVTGSIQVHYSTYYGYDMTNDNLSLWSAEIRGPYICGDDGMWSYYIRPHYTYQKAINAGGVALILFLTLCFGLALTGVWPLLVSIDMNVMRILDEEEGETTASPACNLKYVWLGMSGLAIVVLAGIMANTACIALRWPSITKTVQTGECYYIDTSALAVPPAANGRRLLADDDAARADVSIQSDGKVTFTTNCEASLYQASTGVVWSLVPEYVVQCVDVPAVQIVEFSNDRQTKCGLTSWKPAGEQGTRTGYDDSVIVQPVRYGRCGWLNIAEFHWRASVSYKVDRTQRWQYCNKARYGAHMYRILPSGRTEILTFENALTVDPEALGRQYGWYTSGSQEVVSHATFYDGIGSSIIFRDMSDAELRAHITSRHIRVGQRVVEIVTPQAVSVQPNSLECRIQFTLKNGADFEEFQLPCAHLEATVVDDGVSGVKISTSSDTPCTAIVGFGDNNWTTVVTLKRSSPVSLRGADRWRCTTVGTSGENCSADHPMTAFDAAVVAATLNTTVTSLGSDETGNFVSDLKFPTLPGMFDLSGVADVVVVVVIALASLAVLLIIVAIVVRIACRRKKHDDFLEA